MDPIFELLWPALTVLSLLATFTTWVALRAPGSYRLKLLLVPVALVACTAAAPLFVDLLGRAAPLELPPKFVLLAHNVIVKGSQKAGIEVWARVGASTRLYVIPYSKQAEEAFAGGEKAAAHGGRVEITRRGRGGHGDSRDEYESNLVLPEADAPKDAPARPEPPAPAKDWL